VAPQEERGTREFHNSGGGTWEKGATGEEKRDVEGELRGEFFRNPKKEERGLEEMGGEGHKPYGKRLSGKKLNRPMSPFPKWKEQAARRGGRRTSIARS